MIRKYCKTLSLLLAACLGILYQAAAQPCNITQLPDTVYACPNATVQLNAIISGPYQSFRWIPAQGLSDTTVLNPVATMGATPVTYRLVVYAFTDTNLVINGDFEQGYTGFTTPGYTASCGFLSNPGSVCICTNPSIKHPNLFQTDHTTGTGNMLYIDPITTAVSSPWRQTVNVTPNRNYLFGGWINNASLPTLSGLDSHIVQPQINGALLGQRLVVHRLPDVWVPFNAVWNSGANTSAILELTNHNLTHGGNDYVVDDFSLREICIDTAIVHIAFSPPTVVDLGGNVSVCTDSVLLGSSVSYTNPSYRWNTGATTASIYVGQSGVYWLEVMDNGCPPASDTITVDLQGSLSVDLGADTAICERNLPFILSSPQPAGTHYLWSNGYSDSVMTVIRSDRYWLYVSRNGCEGSDTIVVEVVQDPQVFIGGYQVICSSVPENIGMVVPDAEYLWNTGARTSHVSVSQTGEYWLEVNLKGCSGRDTAYIVAMPDPAINLGPDGYICTDEELMLDAGNAGSLHYWNTGDTGSVLSVRTEGLYHVTVVSPDSCIGRDSIRLTYLPDPVVYLGADTTVCEETPLTLRPSQHNAESLVWSDGSVGDVLSVRYGGQYIVTAINYCGSDQDTINLQQIFCDIWVPNVFTPNGDGLNDVFRVLGNVGRTEAFGFSIYNRWGQRLFHTSDRYKGWDGHHNGGEALMGTYIYVLKYELAGKPVLQKGNFHLIR